MLRVLLVVLALLCPAAAAPAADDPPRLAPRPLASALHAMQAGRWEVAARLAARDGPAAAALVEWHRLRAGRGAPADVMAFLGRHGDWPGLSYLRKRSEAAMAQAGRERILRFYADYLPQTGTGALSQARALLADGRQGEAEAALVLAWRTLDLSKPEHDAFLQEHGDLLAPHHRARLEMALWRGLRDVEYMLPLVDDAARRRAEAHSRIENARDKVAPILEELSAADRQAPLVAHATFNAHLRANRTQEAIDVILRQSRIEGGLGVPARWAGWRRALARARMRDGDPETAYALAAVHQLVAGAAYADLEWLSGYLALTHLDAPQQALDHFQRFSAAVDTPISKGRAGYWIGRTQEALGDGPAAQIAYGRAAHYQTGFYGLLAAEAAGVPPDPDLAGDERFPDWRGAAFTESAVHKAAVLALAAGRRSLAERFFLHLSQSQDREGLGQMGQMLGDLGQPHLQVMLGKAAARRGIVLHGPYFALHPMTGMDLPVPMELALSIARRESEFDARVTSGAGAQGLMQLMPGTAADVARALDLEITQEAVRGDWRVNARLGAGYLAQLADRFDGNVVLMAVGYNAGPGRLRGWIDRFGDPRGGDRDVVDWIEHIPFRETRNYVMRVAESLPVYRARLGRDPHPVPFSEELIGATLRPGGARP